MLLVTLLMAVLIAIMVHQYLKMLDPRVMVRAVDGREYLVVDGEGKQASADALARLNDHVMKLIAHMQVRNENSNEFRMAVERLKSRYDPTKLSEGLLDKNYTSFTVNKGEQIVFCLKPRDGHNPDIYEDNLLLYVAMHELAHIMSISEQHTPEFHRNFNYLIANAKEIGIFRHSDEKVDYCGLVIPKY